MEKFKRKELDFDEKIVLIKQSQGKSQRRLAAEFGIGKTQVQSILKRKSELLEEYEINGGSNRKRLCKRSPVEELNILMWEWFQKIQKAGVRVSGPMLQEKALLFAKELDISGFKASKGWLNRFRERNNISFQTICGESGSVDRETVNQWLARVPSIIEGYKPEDIYNMDETGLYYRALPDKSLCVRGEEFKGGKRSKERLTVMLCVNVAGEFEKPLMIGKCQRPRCFKHVNVDQLPVTWQWNKKAWMTTNLFLDWIKSFDKRMRYQGRKVLLLLDNATSHPENIKLTNIKLCFLPKNTTSVLQPLDQGILQHMKVMYRKRLIRSVLTKIDDGETVSAESISKSVTVLDALHFVNLAVKDINSETVRKCFKKAGITFDSTEEEFEDDDVPLLELVEIMRAAQEKIITTEAMTAQEFSNIDSDAPIHEELDSNWEQELVKSVQRPAEDECPDSDGEDSDIDDGEPVVPVTSHTVALKMLEQLKAFSLTMDLPNTFTFLQGAQEGIEKHSVKIMSKAKQTSIGQFFTPQK